MLVIVDLDGCIDPASDWHILDLAIRAGDAQSQILLRLEVRVQAEHIVEFVAIELVRLRVCALLKLQGQHDHPDAGAGDAHRRHQGARRAVRRGRQEAQRQGR